MKKYPIWQDGEKLVLEDIAAAALLAGRADDVVRGGLEKIYIEDTNRKGYLKPWKEGPIVVSSSNDGKVIVHPFWAYMSPAGASSGAGTEAAAPGSESYEDILTAFSAEQLVSIQTPLPTTGNMRWDLLYAIISEADNTAADRLVASVASGTKTVAVQNINTRHSATVTLAWVQGTSSPTATNPYPSGSMPAVPTPSSGQAIIPIAYVQVQYSATPSTASYTVDRIANCARLARINSQQGANICAQAVVATDVTDGAVPISPTPVSLITLASSHGGWAPSGSNIKPVMFSEPVSGGVELWIQLGPFSVTSGHKTFGTAWADSTFIPVALPDPIAGIDFRYRRFRSSMFFDTNSSDKHAHDLSNAVGSINPTSYGGVPYQLESWGQSIRKVDAWEGLGGVSINYYLAGWFHLDTGVEIALLVYKGTGGGLYIQAKNAADEINHGTGWIHMFASGVAYPLGRG